ncbi:MAG: autophagy- protein 2 [Sclerophora amabilis]|nr:MAG: autophagy- protein 2 [Sclerophora amabilis]
MASLFLPYSWQKRLLRYALSRLELLDTDALDLENLDIAWGRQSTVNLRDVGLRIKKLSSLLQLPRVFEVSRARIILLRITVPADIYHSPIIIELEGIEAQVHVLSEGTIGDPHGAKVGNRQHNRRSKRHASDAPGKQADLHEAGEGSSQEEHSGGDKQNEPAVLPSTTDLATSFLQTENLPEKVEMEAKLASQSHESQRLGSIYGGETDDELLNGTGVAFTLPAFLASFLKGIGDRLEVRIRGVNLIVHADLQTDAIPGCDSDAKIDTVAMHLSIEHVDVEGVTAHFSEAKSLSPDGGGKDGLQGAKEQVPIDQIINVSSHDGRRQIRLSKISARLISHPAVFQSFSRLSGHSSPTATHSTLSREGKTSQSPRGSEDVPPLERASRASSSRSFDSGSTATKSAFAETSEANRKQEHGVSCSLDVSSVMSDTEKFANASDDEDDGDTGTLAAPVGALSVENSRFPDDSHYLDQLNTSHLGDSEPEDINDSLAFATRIPQDDYSHNTPSFLGDSRSIRRGSSSSTHDLSIRSVEGRPAADILSSPTEVFHGAYGSDEKSASPPGAQESGVFEKHYGEADYDSDGLASPGEDLSVSKIFSHEEAESMYMSALSGASTQGSEQQNLSGQAYSPESGAQSLDAGVTSSSPCQLEQSSPSTGDDEFPVARQSSLGLSRGLLDDSDHPGTPRPRDLASCAASRPYEGSPPKLDDSVHGLHDLAEQDHESGISSDLPQPYSRIAKQILDIDTIVLWLPSETHGDVPARDLEHVPTNPVDTDSIHGSSRHPSFSTHVDVPGAFSAYASQRGVSKGFQGSSQVYHDSRIGAEATSPKSTSRRSTGPESNPSEKADHTLKAQVGIVRSQFDMPVGRLLAKLTRQVSGSIANNASHSTESASDTSASKLVLEIQAMSIKFVERLEGMSYSPTSSEDMLREPFPTKRFEDDTLLRVDVKNLSLARSMRQDSTSSTEMSIEKFCFGHAKEDIISFDSSLKMRTSTKDILQTDERDILLSIDTSQQSRKIRLGTLPIQISLDLQRLDETFSWFGGFSSIIGLGSSMMSNTTITGLKPVSQKGDSPRRSRGVRFETPSAKNPLAESSSSDSKIDVRLGGVAVDLLGKDCSIRTSTTALKLVSRDGAIGAQVDRIRLSGPHLRHGPTTPSSEVEVGSTRLVYLSHPEEADLGRLLSLLTPSKAKYDRDDDILVDTLLRQRKQGPVLRVNVANLGGKLARLEDTQYLPGLADEIAKLSSVTKYLPDDDRPGVLILGLVKDLNFQFTINSQLGSLSLALTDTEIAHVSLPSLTALGIHFIRLDRNDVEVLVQETVCQSSPVEHPPMMMARMIGDEMEPTIKVKLNNMQIEYRVSTVLAVMGLTDEATTEKLIADLAGSVATLTDRTTVRPSVSNPQSSSASSEWHGQNPRHMKIDVHLRDCILGLNPLDLPSKALVVLTDTHLNASRPKQEPLHANLDINKASLLIIDDVDNIVDMESDVASARRKSFGYGTAQVASLSAMGFVSISYVSSAKAFIRLIEADSAGETSLDFELKDNLLVIESCADSTQTLLAIFNGLKPPSTPMKDLKYRTEIVPIQDMLASLSGDAFVSSRPKGAANNFPLDTVEEEADAGEMSLDLDFSSSRYDPDHGAASEELADSMLQENFVDFADPPPLTRDIGDQVLLESFQEQYHAPSDQPLEFLDDYFGSGSLDEWTAHRWDSVKNAYETIEKHKLQESPLRARIRNVHIIWNLFDGYDWQRTRDAIDKAVKEVEGKALEARNQRRGHFDVDQDDESVIGDFLFNSIYIGIPANRDPRDLSHQINRHMDDVASETESQISSTVSRSPSRQAQPSRFGGKRLRLHRSKHHKMTFELREISVDMNVYPPGSGETQSSLDVQIRDLEIFDHVPTSTWKKFATYMHDAGERESGMSMIHLKVLNVKPIPELAASEMVVKVNVLPLRLHVDQDALDFMTRFFEFKDQDAPTGDAPSDGPFFQRVEVNRVQIRLDYKPKAVDYAGLRSGHTTEFMNFFILDQADMFLERVIIHGVSGMDKLSKTLNDTWMPDIKRNQLPNVLSGLAPVRSIVNVGGGVRDLVVIPMREYRKDGRIVRSIQKGALAFAKTTTSELAKLGAKLAIGTQTVLQGAEGFLNKPEEGVDAGWEDTGLDEEEKKAISLYADQPIGVVQGLRGAYSSLGRDLLTARDAIIAVPGEILESGSAQGAAKAMAKRAPTVIFRPAIGASKAISQTLMGANNTLDPQHRRRIEEVKFPLQTFDVLLLAYADFVPEIQKALIRSRES